ncbi:MAG TPA: hypothetical protein VGE85_05115 [Terracidiphilus sp.]|jgi:hypothetical protein
MRVFASIFHSSVFKSYWAVLALLFVLALASHTAQAQSLGYEGPTGIFVTPLASTAASPAKGFGKPVVGYHFLAAGNVVGDYSTVSVTEGFAKRFEFGITEEIHAGSNQLPIDGVVVQPEYKLSQDFSILHGKATVLTSKALGSIAVGGIYRFHDNNVYNGAPEGTSSGAIFHQGTRNGDIYLVGTRVFTGIKKVPILFNAGLRGTDASVWGLGGNAPGFSARGFGALAFIFTLPNKSTLILGSEAAQQPQRVKLGLGQGLDIPTTVVYAARFIPSPKHKLNIDVGVLHASDGLQNPVLNTKDRAAFGLSYAF